MLISIPDSMKYFISTIFIQILTGFLLIASASDFHFLQFSSLLAVFQSCSRNSRVICRTEWFRKGFIRKAVFQSLGIILSNPVRCYYPTIFTHY